MYVCFMAQYFQYNPTSQYTFYENSCKYQMPFELMLKLKMHLRQVTSSSTTPIAAWIASLTETEINKIEKIDLLTKTAD